MAAKKMSALWVEEDQRFAFGVAGEGAIEIESSLHLELLSKQAAGLIISRGPGGLPVALEPAPLTIEELTARALGERDVLLRVAASRMAPLQDAVDLGESSAAEDAALLLWKRYRVALNRIEQQPGFPSAIDWPVSPDAE